MSVQLLACVIEEVLARYVRCVVGVSVKVFLQAAVLCFGI
jgi:hypothetical protein